MFGKKKNQNNQTPSQSSNNNSVHTMQDDIDIINKKSQIVSERVNTPSSDPLSNVQQPIVTATSQKIEVSESLVDPAETKIALSKKQRSDVDKAVSEPNPLDHFSPFTETEKPSNVRVTKTTRTADFNKTSEPSTNSPVLNTSNPSSNATNTSIPTIATSSEAPEASSASVSMSAQQLTKNTPPVAPQQTSDLPADSPFNTSHPNPVTNPFPQTPTTEETPSTLENEISKIQQEYGEIQNSDDTPKTKKYFYMSFIFIILIVLIISGGGYYYWISQEPEVVTSEKEIYNDTVNEDVAITEEIVQETQEYSETLPHYILIDTQSDTALNDFTQELETITENIRTQQPLGAISFIITDENSIPLSFKQFALLTNITLPQEVLEQIDESFLLYEYYDNGEVRLGLSAQTIDPDLVLNAMKDAEPTLVIALRPLFAGDVPETTTPTFADGTYNQTPIRYANLNTTETLSIDYAIYSGDLVIGTSKGTIRAIINTL